MVLSSVIWDRVRAVCKNPYWRLSGGLSHSDLVVVEVPVWLHDIEVLESSLLVVGDFYVIVLGAELAKFLDGGAAVLAELGSAGLALYQLISFFSAYLALWHVLFPSGSFVPAT